MILLEKIKFYIIERLFGRITRELRYRKRLKELKSKDPYIYK